MELIRQYLLKEPLFLEYALEEQQIACVRLLMGAFTNWSYINWLCSGIPFEVLGPLLQKKNSVFHVNLMQIFVYSKWKDIGMMCFKSKFSSHLSPHMNFLFLLSNHNISIFYEMSTIWKVGLYGSLLQQFYVVKSLQLNVYFLKHAIQNKGRSIVFIFLHFL